MMLLTYIKFWRRHLSNAPSFWDAMLWATVRRAGVRLLVSEDFQDGQTIEGVRIINPFAAQNSVLIERALGD